MSLSLRFICVIAYVRILWTMKSSEKILKNEFLNTFLNPGFICTSQAGRVGGEGFPVSLMWWNILIEFISFSCGSPRFSSQMSSINFPLKCLALFKVFLKVYLFLAVLDLCCCTWAFSSCREWGLLSSCHARASPCGGFSCYRAQALGPGASVVTALRLSSCGSWALEGAT